MGETVDVLVVGRIALGSSARLVMTQALAGRYGTGRRSGGVSTLLCAVLDDRRRVEEDDELKSGSVQCLGSSSDLCLALRYTTFVRVGSGFSFADYVEIRARPWKDWDPKKPPTFLLTADKGIDDKGDVYLEPSE
jgi:DNA ligase-4